jgi:RNA polymerase sigma-70 factor, ECF subfamily
MTRLIDIAIDADVLARAQAGEPDAQAHVYLAFASSTYALIRRVMPRAAVADDLFQDTFVEVLQSLHSFRGDAPLGAWIRRIALSKCLMYLRSPWHRSLLWLDQLAGDGGDALPPTVASITQDQANPALQQDLEVALAKLPTRARAVVWLHDVEGFTHDEIARHFGMTVSFSKSQLMRAHLRLRELLQEQAESSTCIPVSTSF